MGLISRVSSRTYRCADESLKMLGVLSSCITGCVSIADKLFNPVVQATAVVVETCISPVKSVAQHATFEGSPFMYKMIAFGATVYLIDVYIASRQRAIYRNKSVKLPEILEDIMSEEKFDKYLPAYSNSEFALTFTYMLTSGLVEQIISLPFSLYSQFVIEEKHGFNKMALGFYFTDMLKKMGISWLIQAPLIWVLIWTIRKTGDYFVVATWGVVFFFSMVMMTIYPAYIAPLFDKYTALEDGPLKSKIEKLAGKLDFPLKKLFVVDGSNRSSHSNAYMYGFRKNKRIVLFDTLIHGYKMADESENDKGCNDEEIVAVLGHELGHWKMGHVWKNLVVMQGVILASFYGFSLVFNNAELFAQFGFNSSEAPPCLIQLMFTLGYFMAPVNEVIGIIMTMFSRHNEYEADEFSFKLDESYGP